MMDIREYEVQQLYETKGILLYGAAGWGKLVLETLQWEIRKDTNLVKKQIPILFVDRLKSEYCNVKIINKTEIVNYPDYDILICAPSSWKEIIDELEEQKVLNKIFGIGNIIQNPKPKMYLNPQDCYSGNILKERYDYYKNRNLGNLQSERVILPFLCVCVTERCSLNCEKCIAMMPHYKKPQNYFFEDMEIYLDRLIASVNSILEVGFAGGEVFVNKEFYKYVEWAIKQPKIKAITITTNATIIPDEQTLNLFKNEKVVIALDDYGKISTKLNEWIELSKKNNYRYCIMKNQEWQDIGDFDRKYYTSEKRNLIYNNCSFKDCHLFLNGRVYRCQRQAHLVNLGVCQEDELAYVDFTKERDSEDYRNLLVQLLQRKKALLACDYCNDITEKIRPIPVASQVEK